LPRPRLTFNPVIAMMALLCTSCGGTIVYRANEARGRINFNGPISPKPGSRIIVESSSEGFVKIQGRTEVNNEIGLLSVPFRLALSSTGDVFEIRAFQDEDGNSRWTDGETLGLYDKTFVLSRIVKVEQLRENELHLVSDDNDYLDGISITIDSEGGSP
jgi:hypothetical protein